jgi:hypothetical protein
MQMENGHPVKFLYPQIINTPKGRVKVYTEDEHKAISPDHFAVARKLIADREANKKNSSQYPKFINVTNGRKLVKSKTEEDSIRELMKGGIPVLLDEKKKNPPSPIPVVAGKYTGGASALMLPKEEPQPSTETVATPVVADLPQAAPEQPAKEAPKSKRKAGRPRKA